MKDKYVLLVIAVLGLCWYVTLSTAIATPINYNKCISNAKKAMEKELYNDVISEYESALTYKPNDLVAKKGLAKVYLVLDRKSDFVSESMSIISMTNGEAEDTIQMLEDYYIDKGKYEDAIDLALDFKAKYPDNKTVQKYYKQLRGQYDEMYCSYDHLGTIFNGYAVYQSGEEFGVVKSNGKTAFDKTGEYAGVFFDTNTAAPMVSDGMAYYVDEDGIKAIVPDTKYDYLGVQTEDYVVASKNGKYGYLSLKMDEVCEFVYDDATAFYNHVAAVKKGKKWAIINSDFEQITDFIYDDVAMDENRICSKKGVIWVCQKEKYILIDKTGNPVTKADYDEVREFISDEATAVKKNGKWGFVNYDGSVMIECIYEDAKPFREGMAPVCKDGKWGYIDTDNEFVIVPRFEDATPFYSDGRATVQINGSWTIIQLYSYS